MRLLLLGPPGAGKGTQAKELEKILKVPHISTGDIFRNLSQDSTPQAEAVKQILSRGQLVPDELTIAIVKTRLQKSDCSNGFILDGFPRNLNQAKALDEILSQPEISLDLVLNLVLPEEEIIKRLSSRLSCPACGRVHNLAFSPPQQEGICDLCETSLIQRDDDQPEVIKKRLQVYQQETAPLLSYYQQQGKLQEIDANFAIGEVLAKLKGLLKVKTG